MSQGPGTSVAGAVSGEDRARKLAHVREEQASARGVVVCVGVPDEISGEIARLLAGRTTMVLAPGDRTRRAAVLSAAGLLDQAPQVAAQAAWDHDDHPVITRGRLTMDRERREVTWGGRLIRLSARSFDLLYLLAEDPGRAWTFAELTERVWGRRYLGDAEAVISAVKRLRRNLAQVTPQITISSVRGVGFRVLGLTDDPGGQQSVVSTPRAVPNPPPELDDSTEYDIA